MRGLWVTLMGCLALCASASAQEMPVAVIELQYRPTARAQVALWIEDADGTFLTTVRLTEAVAYRGIGNRPGASEMNSGYRWPYGRREGVLPVWATRRASAPGAGVFKRVIFQNRVEGYASRTANDQSGDNYFCLQFDTSKSSRDHLDAVSCATKFSSDKGRYITASDVNANYGEPYESVTGSHAGSRVSMPASSLYPPRMDVTRCAAINCFDSGDVAQYANDVRDVMPEIDVVTTATAPGDALQKVLFTIPADWPAGNYVAWLEINVEGDYGPGWGVSAYPAPTTPKNDWDSWARDLGYGYAYRGQPSIAYQVPFTLGAIGEEQFATDAPAGRASWDVWSPSYGTIAPPDDMIDDPNGAPGSGADRLRVLSGGHRFVVQTNVLDELPEPPPDAGVVDGGIDPDAGVAGDGGGAAGEGAGGSGAAGSHGGAAGSGGDDTTKPDDVDEGEGVIIPDTGGGVDGPVGAIYDLRLAHAQKRLRAHTWIDLRFRAAEASLPIHSYDVRIATEPIVDEASFIRNGRPAKNATDDVEGATMLMLPTDVPAGRMIDTEIGDLSALTHYYVAVRATDELNRHGPISVAEITTLDRRFATVTPCFVATAAYGSPLASELDVLRRLRERELLTHPVGRALVAGYYTVGPKLARLIEGSDVLRAGVRALLTPWVWLARALTGEPSAG